jgi:hypothetical protein
MTMVVNKKEYRREVIKKILLNGLLLIEPREG